MVSQRLEDKLDQFLDKEGDFSKLQDDIKEIKNNDLKHIETRLENLENNQKDIKKLLYTIQETIDKIPNILKG